jgi:hypothetical protein
MTIETNPQYQHLEPRPGSNYRILFLKGRRIRAALVDAAIHGPDPRTPEEYAWDFQVPLEAVLEAVDDVARNRPLIKQERDRGDQARLQGAPLSCNTCNRDGRAPRNLWRARPCSGRAPRQLGWRDQNVGLLPILVGKASNCLLGFSCLKWPEPRR